MKNILKILAVAAVLLLVVLQYFIIANVYKVLEQNLLSTMDDNPYRVLFSKMFILVLISALIIIFVIFCFIDLCCDALKRQLEKLKKDK